jgi:5-formyltetrahydrofolate cyclo-ligase
MMVPPNLPENPGVMTITSKIDSKIELRRQSRARRRDFVAALSPSMRAGLEGDLAAVIASHTAGYRNPASYAARGAEIDPRFIEETLAPCAFPRVFGRDMFFHLAALHDLSPGFGDIAEPCATAPLVTPDLVLVPLTAATLDGRRLGQGGGFYDRTLRLLRAQGRVVAIGIAWDVQITDSLPCDPWDELLDHIATPTRLVDCARNR